MKIDEQWECWTLCATKINARTGREKGRHLWPRLVQKIAEGETSYELGHFLCNRICSQLEMMLSARSHELLRRKCAKLQFLASEWLGLFSPTYLELFPASPGRCPAAGNHLRYFSDPTGSNTITIPDWIGNTSRCPAAGNHLRYFSDPTGSNKITIHDWIGNSAAGHLEKWETALDRCWRKVQVIPRWETADSHIFGAKARANVPIAPFPTDCKSDCARSGLRLKSKSDDWKNKIKIANFWPPRWAGQESIPERQIGYARLNSTNLDVVFWQGAICAPNNLRDALSFFHIYVPPQVLWPIQKPVKSESRSANKKHEN